MHWMFEMFVFLMACIASLAVLAAFACPIAHAMAGSFAIIAGLACPTHWKDAIKHWQWRWMQSKRNGARLANSTELASLMPLLQVLKWSSL